MISNNFFYYLTQLAVKKQEFEIAYQELNEQAELTDYQR